MPYSAIYRSVNDLIYTSQGYTELSVYHANHGH